MAATQRCPECGEPVPPGARFCSLGHPQPVAETDDGPDRTTDLGPVGYRDGSQDPMATSALPAAPPPQDAGRGRPTRRIVNPPEASRSQPPREEPPPHPPERFAAAPPPGYPAQDGSGLQRVRRSPSGGLVFAILALGILAAAAWYFLQARGDGAEAPGVVASAPESATAQAPPTAAPSTPAAQTYEIQAGDSLSTIALEYGTTVAAIAAANDIADPNLITIGQELVIPPPAPETGTAAAPAATPSP